ncbi:MAG: hypothetical protein KY446_08345 [Proteobacteria bacterium]|nr:hypothetical protein [Pseudomonadota bacterium]MBW3617747.1 hypothetical protein [Pseudomonadota bacterium]
MPVGRLPNPRQLYVLRHVAKAGGASKVVTDQEAAQECLDWGWLLPEGATGFRLAPEGWAVLRGINS